MILDALRACPVIGIMRGFDWADLEWALPIYARAGFTLVEVTMNTPDAADLIERAVATFGDTLHIGAGTVRTGEDLDRARDAGATFIVTPTLQREVMERNWAYELPIFPGALSPTEVDTAWRLGATAVKVFPASLGGPDYIRDLRGPMQDIRLLPTGGVALEDIPAYREAGAYGLGLGSPLFPTEWIHRRNDHAWQNRLESIRKAVTGWHKPSNAT